jgi:uncharacterized protein
LKGAAFVGDSGLGRLGLEQGPEPMRAMMFGRLSAVSFRRFCQGISCQGVVHQGLLSTAIMLMVAVGSAEAAPTLRQGAAAMARQDYTAAARILSPLAQHGDANAQAYMGYLYEIGRGVPQDLTQAALWYRRAAEQGQSWAQFQIGMFYDRGHGVPVDVVEAEKWLILATASAPATGADDRTRIRDAVRTKMTRGELAEARMRALAWQPRREE